MEKDRDNSVSSLPAPRALGTLHKCGFPAHLQDPLGIQETVKLYKFGHEPGPTGLVAGAKPRAIITVEVFVKEYVITPVGVALELLRSAVDGSPALLVTGEDPG